MITTKKHIAILSLLVCLLASVALAFSFGSVTKAKADGETSYTLTFLGEPTNMIKEGWSDGYATIADDVMTLSFASGTDAYSPDVSLKNGTKYLIKMDIKSNADTETGCWVYADTSRVTADQSWDAIFAGATVEGTATIDSSGVISKIGSTWSTVSLVYTPAKDILCLRFTDWNKKGLQIKNFTISEVVNTKTFTAAGAIGDLPTIPEKTGYAGHWEIDGEPITAETTFAATANKIATAVYDKIYTLSFGLESYTEFKNKSTSTASFEGLVATLGTAWDWVEINGTPLTKGKQYTLRIVAKKTAGEGQLVVVDNKWGNTDGVGHTLTDEYTTIDITFTAAKDDATGFYLENSAANTIFDFKSIALINTKTFTAAGAIGELPTIPEKTGYAGHWEIDGEPITAETTFAATANKIATAVYDKIYTLSFGLESYTEFKNKSTATASFEGLVATLGTAWDWVEINGTPLTKGKQYTLRIVAKKTAGEGQLVVVDNKWGNTDGVWHTLTGEYTTIDITFTAVSEGATGFYLENSAANTTFDFKSILLTESATCTDISVVDGDTIGTLPEVPAKDGYIGHWEIDGTEISSATVYDYGSDKNAVAVYEEGYKLAIKDGSSTIYKTVNGTVKLADLGIKDSSTQIVAGYKIDDKLYSADYTFTAAETEIEVVRVAFKVLNGGSIRYIAPVGLRFTANLSETEYNSLKTIVGDGNVSFGIELTRNSNNKLVSVAGNNYYIEDGNIVYSGVIINIPETYYAENFTANAYLSIKYEDKTEAVRIYAVLAGENTRSAYTVAKKAVEAGVTGDALTICQDIVNKVEEGSSSSDTSASAQSVVIGAFEIPSNIATTASYAKDAGIDVLFGAYAGNTTEYFATGASTNESTLQAISDAGLKVYISDLEEINGSRKFDSLLDSGRAASFMNSDAVIGYVIDEPTKTEIDNIANNLAYVKKNFNNKTLYVNLFPSSYNIIT